MIRNRAFFFGQQLAHQRIYARDAHLSAIEMTNRGKNYKGPLDPFADHLMKIVYIHEQPYKTYAQKRREMLRSNRGKPIERMR